MRVPFAICCVLLVILVVGCTHDQDSFYSVRIDAEKKGEFDRGWLPTFLPNSSHAIHLAYDLSPSREWCAFEFDPNEAEILLSGLKPVHSSVPIAGIPTPHLQWWPKVLLGNLNGAAIQQAGFELYTVTRPISQVQNETMVFAMDRKNGRAYFYGE